MEPAPLDGTCHTPVERAAMVHWWDELTFLHWRYPVDAVQRLLPRGLEVDAYDGGAWVGLVPFYLRVALPRLRPIPWVSQFAETNVRTYVRSGDGETGIWFFSLDAARLGAVLVARATYRIPYFWSRMRIHRTATPAAPGNGTITYDCTRRWPGPGKRARSTATIHVGDAYQPGELTELDHFLTARWALYSAPRSGLHHARAAHDPWPLYKATVTDLHDELVAAAGLPHPPAAGAEPPLVHYSPSVAVRIGWPQRATAQR